MGRRGAGKKKKKGVESKGTLSVEKKKRRVGKLVGRRRAIGKNGSCLGERFFGREERWLARVEARTLDPLERKFKTFLKEEKFTEYSIQMGFFAGAANL